MQHKKLKEYIQQQATQNPISETGRTWDSLSITEDKAHKYAEEHINKEPARYLDETNKSYSMEYCLAHSGETINERFRQDRAIPIDYQIADTIKTYKTDTDLIVYRGVCDYVYELMKKNADSLEGADLYEKGFLSTSLVKGHEINSKIKLRIFVPAGTNCVYMGNVNYEPNFYEITIQHGAELQIISIDSDYINCKLLKTA